MPQLQCNPVAISTVERWKERERERERERQKLREGERPPKPRAQTRDTEWQPQTSAYPTTFVI